MKTQKSFATGYSDSGLCLTAIRPSHHPGSAPSRCQVQTKVPNDTTISLPMQRAQSCPPQLPASAQATSCLFASPSYNSTLLPADYGKVGRRELNIFFKTGQPLQWKKWDVVSGCSEDKAAGWALGSQGIWPGLRLCNCPDLGALARADNGK